MLAAELEYQSELTRLSVNISIRSLGLWYHTRDAIWSPADMKWESQVTQGMKAR